MNNKYVFGLACIASLGGFLFGFDTAVISGTTDLVKDQFELGDLLQGWYVSSGLVGCVLGVVIAGFLSDKFGRKRSLIFSAILFSLSAVGCALAIGFTDLVIYRFVGGIGVGVASMLSPIYIAEIAPREARGQLTSLYQLAITFGILVAFLTNAYIQDYALSISTADRQGYFSVIFGSEQWRGMLGAETIPALLFFLLLLTIPESPRWLWSIGKKVEANKIIERYQIQDFGSSDEKSKKPSINYFKAKGIKIAILTGAVLAVLTQTSGINAIMYYGNSILQKGGADSQTAFYGQTLIGVINMAFTFIAIFTIDKIGRKKLLFVGVSIIIASLLLVGAMFYVNASTTLKMIFILTFVAGFAFSYGPVIWVLLSELFPTEIRGRAMSVAVLSLWIANTLVGQFVPWLRTHISESGVFWLFALCCVPTYFVMNYLPETKGKTLEEIENHWLSKNK